MWFLALVPQAIAHTFGDPFGDPCMTGHPERDILGYSMFRNNASGPEIGLPGRILARLLPGKHRNQPSGRPKACRRADLGASSPAKIRPGRPISGPGPGHTRVSDVPEDIAFRVCDH